MKFVSEKKNFLKAQKTRLKIHFFRNKLNENYTF